MSEEISLEERINKLEEENTKLKTDIEYLKSVVDNLRKPQFYRGGSTRQTKDSTQRYG